MAISAQQRQKKLAKKNQKRKLVKKILKSVQQPSNKASSFASLPIHEVLVPSSLFTLGIGNLVLSRQAPSGMIACSSFIVDVFCLGVKDAFFTLLDQETYHQKFRHSIEMNLGNGTLENVHPSCLKKIIVNAVDYAKQYGFTPHKDYHRSIGLLDSIDASACPVSYEYGKDGQPYFIQGPNETPAQIKKILTTLEKHCGKEGFHATLGRGDLFDM
ncbi:MAG: hypothetical protein HQL48_07130 [Gammaproteobacteria bacterium]|nr:hypothetical protein [Gammaproteobacteria bacterium]